MLLMVISWTYLKPLARYFNAASNRKKRQSPRRTLPFALSEKGIVGGKPLWRIEVNDLKGLRFVGPFEL